MSNDEQGSGVGQGGGTGGLTGTELDQADETVERPDLDPDAWDAKPADEEPHHAPGGDEPADERGFAGEDVGRTEGGAPPGPR
ncbi:MAG: hypothetical protein JWO90_143 [Solirubrobacterales bacterium]|jgi:hypothetical protein|nr:hypothetical protein [Solirubrobacterales bacterium]